MTVHRLRLPRTASPAASLPGGYDFAQRAWFDGIGAVGTVLGDVARAPDAGKIGQPLRARLSVHIHEQVPGSPGGIAAAFVTGDRAKGEKLAARYGVNPKNIYNYQNYDSLRDNPDVDIIYIVLPNGMHAEYTIRGAKAGKHILTEKPMANTPQDCEAMIAACKAAGKKLI